MEKDVGVGRQKKGVSEMRKIIVTGGAGFIGSNFIFYMEKHIRVTALSVWIN